ncbi:type II toxin-antitoxin system RelE/ParE family toxin [Blautia producta]|uniref:type II toxin-antitoxin system RelE/ParE family toxin n=1 Tax=Blautia producta TaxID=33035 RepID=UPI0031B57681
MEIKYTPEARDDLKSIKEYLSGEFGSEELTARILKEITGAVRNLAVFPNMGASVSDTTEIATEYRCLFCRKNYIFYRVGKDTIYIVRILNERQDFMRTLFGISDDTE